MFKELMTKDIVKMIEGKTTLNSRELVRGISINSKVTRPGDLFFALKGEHTDGHFFTTEALDNGAVGVVVQRPTTSKSDIVVSDTIFALGELARKYRSSFYPKTIGITGTNGKTTVKKLVASILNKKHEILYTKKNFNSLIGLPLTILELTGTEEYLVLEMGTSNHGEIGRLCEIAKPSIGVITNIGPGHLDGLETIEGIRKEKLSLINCLPEDGFALVGDGVGDVERENVYRFSMDMLDNIRIDEHGSHFTCNGINFFTPLLGLGNVYNCLAAIRLTSIIGVESDIQRTTIADAVPESGRLEPIRINGMLIINDTYNANPVSMKAALDFMATLKRPKVCILGDMRELGEQSRNLHIEIGQYARERCEVLLTTGADARYYGGRHFNDRRALTGYLVKYLNGDEVVLIKASRAFKFENIIDGLLWSL